jgi:hypothetical protein
MQLTLVVPGPLDWTASVLASLDPRAPALARLLASGGAPVIEEDGLVASACRACGIARQGDWPVAPWLAHAAGLAPEHAYWLCAEPATLVVGQDDVRLRALVEDLTAADAAALCATLNAHFVADGVQFLAPMPGHWFARVEQAQQISTRPPEAAQGAQLFAFLPAGADAGRWKRWQSEVQMLLFEHAVNLRREQEALAPVNSVWLWGGGRYARTEATATHSTAIFADDTRLRELARGAALDVAAVPSGFDALPRTPCTTVWLETFDADAAPTRLAAIDRAWMAPVLRALSTGALRELELVLGGRERALRFPVRRSALARRLRARLAPPRLSRLLAGFAPGV